MCMNLLPACMTVYCVHGWCPQTSEQSVRFPKTELMDACEPPCEYQKLRKDMFCARATSVLNP